MSIPPAGNNTPPPPHDSGNNGGEPDPQVVGNQPGEEENQEGGVAVGAQNPGWLAGEDTSSAEESDEDGERAQANNGVQDQQDVPGDAALIRPVTAGWIKIDGRYQEGDTFVPLPKVTFLIDRPQNLTCRLCLVSELRLSLNNQEQVTDGTPALMPCGHIAGAVCLNEAIESMNPGDLACPFCRYPLTYTGCGHRVPEQLLTEESVRVMPETVPNGGVVPALCSGCRQIRVQLTYRAMIRDAQTDVMAARANYASNRADEAARQLSEFVRLFEKLPVEEAKKIARIRSGAGSW